MIEFEKQRYSAVVATVHESSEQVVEVLRRDDGLFDLIIHNQYDGSWEDMSVTLDAGEFLKLGQIPQAPLPTDMEQ